MNLLERITDAMATSARINAAQAIADTLTMTQAIAAELALHAQEITPRQTIATAQVYLRTMQADTPQRLEPAEWIRTAVQWNPFNGILTIRYAGMVLAVEPDGYTHS